ncbi:MAG TPA: prolyl oligopeptidase family serine peptidase [Pirellulales bacterium]|nr:prolyl oligopeptidase family serine peptidase [Pirellulales bacterium]
MNAPSRRDFLRAAASAALATRGGSLVAAEDDVPSIAERMKASDAAAPLAMQFDGAMPDDARQWQARFGATLRALLGRFDPPEHWQCVLERRVELSDHLREERVLRAEGLAPVPFHLLLPRGGGAKRAGIVAVHGHGTFAHDSIAGIDDTQERRDEIEKFKYDYGRKLVERGHVVAAPCLTPFGRRLGVDKKSIRGDPCTLVNLQLEHLGKLLITENLRDVLWTLEYLARHDAVDADRLGCVGLSYGGRMTTLAAAVDSRIKVAVIAGALNCLQANAMEGKTAGCQVIPGLLKYGDIPEIAGLVAPRACLWEAGSTDPHVPADWAERAFERQRRVYAALHAADQVAVDHFDGGHVWHGEVAYPLLEKVLRS